MRPPPKLSERPKKEQPKPVADRPPTKHELAKLAAEKRAQKLQGQGPVTHQVQLPPMIPTFGNKNRALEDIDWESGKQTTAKVQDIFDLARERFGGPVNVTHKWHNTAQPDAHFRDLAGNMITDLMKEIGLKTTDVDRRALLLWAAIGCVTGVGICDIYGAYTALLLKLNGYQSVRYVGNDAHNWSMAYNSFTPEIRASHSDTTPRLSVDPWHHETYEHEVEQEVRVVLAPTRVRYDFRNGTENNTLLWAEFLTMVDTVKAAFTKLSAQADPTLGVPTAYAHFMADTSAQQRRLGFFKDMEKGVPLNVRAPMLRPVTPQMNLPLRVCRIILEEARKRNLDKAPRPMLAITEE